MSSLASYASVKTVTESPDVPRRQDYRGNTTSGHGSEDPHNNTHAARGYTCNLKRAYTTAKVTPFTAYYTCLIREFRGLTELN